MRAEPVDLVDLTLAPDERGHLDREDAGGDQGAKRRELPLEPGRDELMDALVPAQVAQDVLAAIDELRVPAEKVTKELCRYARYEDLPAMPDRQ